MQVPLGVLSKASGAQGATGQTRNILLECQLYLLVYGLKYIYMISKINILWGRI